MQVQIVNQSKSRIPQKFINEWILSIQKEFLRKKVLTKEDLKKDLTLVFLDPAPAKKLNFEFRQKNYATDVLSFDGMEPSSLGELVLCPEVLKKQAKEHGLPFKFELGYMLIHGILHLKGYDHEKSKKEAQKMFELQDSLFDKLLIKF